MLDETGSCELCVWDVTCEVSSLWGDQGASGGCWAHWKGRGASGPAGHH